MCSSRMRKEHALSNRRWQKNAITVRREYLIWTEMSTTFRRWTLIFNPICKQGYTVSFSNRPIYRVHIFRIYNSFISYLSSHDFEAISSTVKQTFEIQRSLLFSTQGTFKSWFEEKEMSPPPPTDPAISNITVHKIPFVHGISKLYAVWCNLSSLGSTSRIVILLLKSHNSELLSFSNNFVLIFGPRHAFFHHTKFQSYVIAGSGEQ